MFDRSAVRIVRWVAQAILLIGIVLAAALILPALNAGNTLSQALFTPLALIGCGVGVVAAFLWAMLILQAMNAENLQRIRQLVEDEFDRPPMMEDIEPEEEEEEEAPPP